MKLEKPLNIVELHRDGDLNAVYHFARYYWAAAVIAKLSQRLGRAPIVLDIGCGYGYGAEIIGEIMKSAGCDVGVRYAGIDNDEKAIEFATEHFHSHGRFSLQDLDDVCLAALPHQAARPDVVICFDVISQLRHRDIFLYQLSELLEGASCPLLFSCQMYDGDRAESAVGDEFNHVNYSRAVISRFMRKVIGPYYHRRSKNFPQKSAADNMEHRLNRKLCENVLYFGPSGRQVHSV